MKGLNKLVLVSAIAAAPFAQAELKAIDDATMAEMTGQSGLVIEVAMGSTAATGNESGFTSIGLDTWEDAGIHIDAFKWEVDLEAYDMATNEHAFVDADADGIPDAGTGLEQYPGVATDWLGGVIAQDIRIAGKLDMTVDGVVDAGNLAGGIAIGFHDSAISMRINSINVYGGSTAGGDQAMILGSMGAIEIINMNLKDVDLTISGRGQ